MCAEPVASGVRLVREKLGRLRALLVLTLLLAVSAMPTQATIAPQEAFTWWMAAGRWGGPFPTALEACQKLVTESNKLAGYERFESPFVIFEGPSNPFCQVHYVWDQPAHSSESCYGRSCGVYGGLSRSVSCPANSTSITDGCQCKPGSLEDETRTSCVAGATDPPIGQSCKIPAGLLEGHPIAPASAEKYRSEPDFVDSGPGPLSFIRTYRSNWSSDASRTAAAMGQVWTHNHSYTLTATPSGAPVSVVITLPEGYIRQFSKAAGASAWTTSNSADTLVQVGSAWTWKRSDDYAIRTTGDPMDAKFQKADSRRGQEAARALLNAVSRGKKWHRPLY